MLKDMTLPSKKIRDLAEKRERKELEAFVRSIVKDEVERLLKTKYDSESLLTAQEVEENYGTSISTINRLVNDSILKCQQAKTKGKRLFKKADCDAVFLKEKR